MKKINAVIALAEYLGWDFWATLGYVIKLKKKLEMETKKKAVNI